MKRRHRMGLAGDPGASVEKAAALVTHAISELGDPDRFPQGEEDRRRLRELAHKGWMGLTTAADSYLCATEGRTARTTGQVSGVYQQLGSRTYGQYGIAYEVLHVGCGYRDSKGCSAASVREALRGAGQAIHAVTGRILEMKRNRRATRTCPPEAA